MEPETRLLRYFLAVAEELNFTRAAARLHIAQPSLSAQIRQLESQLGVTLLRRSTRAVTLTEAGQALAERGPAALVGLHQAWDAARQAGHGESGELHLAYPLSAGHDTVPRLVQALHERYPSITVHTEVLPSPQVLHAVRDGRVEAGIARAPAALPGVRLLPLRRDPLGALVAAEHPLADRDAVELAAVAAFPLVVHPRAANPPHYDYLVGLFSAAGLQPTLVERDIAFDLTQRYITAGEAVTLIGHSNAQGAPGNLAWIPLTDPVTLAIELVLPTGRPSPVAERFARVALRYGADNAWLPAVSAASGGQSEAR